MLVVDMPLSQGRGDAIGATGDAIGATGDAIGANGVVPGALPCGPGREVLLGDALRDYAKPTW